MMTALFVGMTLNVCIGGTDCASLASTWLSNPPVSFIFTSLQVPTPLADRHVHACTTRVSAASMPADSLHPPVPLPFTLHVLDELWRTREARLHLCLQLRTHAWWPLTRLLYACDSRPAR